MKVKKTSVNCATVEIQGEHTHTMFFSNTEKEKTPFKEVHLTWSDFPEDYEGIHVDTFDDGILYMGIPRNVELKIRLGNKSEVVINNE